MTTPPTAEPLAPIGNSPPADKQFFSTGHLACRFQIPVQTVRQILGAAGIAPAMHINEVEHWDGFAMIALGRAVRDGKADTWPPIYIPAEVTFHE